MVKLKYNSSGRAKKQEVWFSSEKEGGFVDHLKNPNLNPFMDPN